jgi:glycerol-3-phosphate acyltransferase PlsX
VRIALDAMGGDFLAVPNLQGAYRAIKRSEQEGLGLQVFLVAPHKELMSVLPEAAVDPRVRPENRIDLKTFDRFISEQKLVPVDCTQVVGMDESPSVAMRSKKDSSMAVAYRMVKEGKADATVSAGNSGAMMALGIGILGRMNEIKRPAILIQCPTLEGSCCILDAGANVDCTSDHLVQFGQMGHIYAQVVLGRTHPRVGLMNIGEEEGKGNDLVRASYPLLKEALGSDFIGSIEGRDIFKGKVDVVVCDGFVGNVILKTAEGVAQIVKEILKREFQKSLQWTAGAWLSQGAFQGLKSKMDYREYGAAPLVGLNGLALVAHGSSDGKAIMNSILGAARSVEQNLMPRLLQAFGDSNERKSDVVL